MTFRYSESVPIDKVDTTKEILSAAADPNVISFAGGLPAPELFPIAEIKKATDEVFDKYGDEILQYAKANGYKGLRKQIVQLMEDRQVSTTVDNVAVVTGSQQGIDLISKMLITPGDVIFVEEPTYLSALDIFNSYGAKIVGIPMDDDGIDTDALRDNFKKYPDVKFLYTIPNFQNPTGRTMTEARRQHLVEFANSKGMPIIEDDPYGAIRYSGEQLPPLKHYDKKGNVVYLSSFSKILAPGFRMGWINASDEFLKNFLLMKQSADIHTDNLVQYIISQFLKDVDINEHIKKITDVYHERADLMLKEIEENFPAGTYHSRPEGGMFIWIKLPKPIDSRKLFEKCIKNGVAFVPGGAFYPNEDEPGTFRLNFSNMKPDEIKTGIQRMGKTINEEMKKQD